MSIAPQVPSLDTGSTPMSVEARIATIKSLIGHRLPSRHLLNLIALACAGASWDEIASADAEARR